MFPTRSDEYDNRPQSPPFAGIDALFDPLQPALQVDELAAEIGREGQARVAIIGRIGVGKRELVSRLRSWPLDWSPPSVVDGHPHVEPLGFFVMVDLPKRSDDAHPLLLDSAESLLLTIGDPALIVYLLDGARGLTRIDYRWIAALRQSGCPLLIAQSTPTAGGDTAAHEVQQALGMPVVQLREGRGDDIEDRLLPAMMDTAPRLALPMAREITSLRRSAARRVMRQTALLTALLGAQPVPGLELPILALTHAGLVMRIGTAFGFAPGGGIRRETAATIGSVMVLQYAAQTAIKLVPILGFAVGGLLSGLSTLIIGEVALRYYEGGATLSLNAVRARLRRSRTN